MNNYSPSSSSEISWTGDLNDDCTSRWNGLMLRAESMDRNTWWWAVSDLETGLQIDSSNNDEYLDTRFTNGTEARTAAETAAREHRNHTTDP